MKSKEHRTTYRKDYTVPAVLVDSIDLRFQLFEGYTDVHAETHFRRNPASNDSSGNLMLYGEDLQLMSLSCDGRELSEKDYSVDEKGLTLSVVDESFTLDIHTRIYPEKNTLLEGLYRSNGNYCTQCEAEGFRRITYFLDRPDILTKYTTRIEADKKTNPVLLANGNLLEEGELDDIRHYAVWQDPFHKPSYLFALVAGDLHYIEDSFTTKSKRDITLRIYVEERNIEKCEHAMRSLKHSMRWDEERFGLEYDLDIFMIVAVDDFNMGAMENKGLNIFNSKYILALPETATDTDYLGIEGVVAHEYFHNWTGNRVTCRDWFQLSLKEGLTVFRDQEFSSDMNSRAVKRINDVQILRANQFREDSGPMAHPVRPDAYVEINNFYTVTVYNKGAEVIRMLHTLVGDEGFRKGMDLYFERYDGQAVTCDDFVRAMEDANLYDLSQFKLWYSQAGTPKLQVTSHFDPNKAEFSLTVKQHCAPTPGQSTKKPFHLPITIGLLDPAGKNIRVTDSDSITLELKEQEETYTFSGVTEKPVVSFLRNFSAPVTVETFQSREELAFLMAHDSDLFNRWEASTQLGEQVIFDTVEALQQGKKPEFDPLFVKAVKQNLNTGQQDKALLALSLQLPSESYLAGKMSCIDPDNLNKARKHVQKQLASELYDEFLTLYQENNAHTTYQINSAAMGQRSLKNSMLGYLMSLAPDNANVVALCLEQYQNSTNMTDTIAALNLVANVDISERKPLLEEFYNKWKDDPLVMDKWLILQATSSLPTVLEEVKELEENPVFSIKNPNKVRSLIGAFGAMNHIGFHNENGEGYQFLADKIIKLNSLNPQIAARLISPFTTWKKYDGERQRMMRDQLERIINTPDLSGDVYEIVKKSL